MTARPETVRLRAYQAGFGDCLLLTVTYAVAANRQPRRRHMLIDFGSRVQRPGGPKMAAIAQQIAQDCDNHLDVVVATHRHQDHIKGFGDADALDHLGPLDPDLVVRPWTDVSEDQRADPGLGLGEASQTFAGDLDAIQMHAAAVQTRFELDRTAAAHRAKDLSDLGVKNVDAIATLVQWGSETTPRWVRAGRPLALGEVMPGVKARVLGPPTLEQVPSLTSYAKTSDEYWLQLAATDTLASLTLDDTAGVDPLDLVAQPDGAGTARWLLGKLKNEAQRQTLRIVEGFDNVLNNTSVIVHLTIGDRTLLLPGDAQAENWSWALDRAHGENGRRRDQTLRDLLAAVELYKVGHHGSRNATPKRLYELWEDRIGTDRALTSVLTTLKNVYHNSVEGEVPKPALVQALAALGPVYSTDDTPDTTGLANKTWWFDLEAAAFGPADYTYTPGPIIG